MKLEDFAKHVYKQWLNDPYIDQETKVELENMAHDVKEINDRFYKDLEFGTGGMRGIIGAGSNRVNRYTIGKATQGLVQYVLQQHSGNPSVVIAYDSRHRSADFALEAALVLAGNGIKAYLMDALRPTPELSFAVRFLKAAAGIVITASHNPPEYNGFKVYGSDGGQMTPEIASKVMDEIKRIHSFSDVKKLTRLEAEQKQLLQWIGEEVDEAYLQALTSVCQHPEVIRKVGNHFRIVFTPLHGTGNIPVRKALRRVGFEQVIVVKEQEQPDPNFSTVDSPNPEEQEAFRIAIEQAEECQADIIIGTDPDADRMGAVVKDVHGKYLILTGNQIGALIVHYLLSSMKSKGTLPVNGAIVKTIVTGELGAHIAEHYGVKVVNTLTGFKYIGQKIQQFEETATHQFIFGYEESYGYLAGNYARDKDAVVASMLICEAAAYYKNQGKMESRTLTGMEGISKIKSVMQDWQQDPPKEINGSSISDLEDFSQGLYGLPKENVLKFHLIDGSWFCLRPSGTEPKIKVYFSVNGSTSEEANEKMERLVHVVMSRIDTYLKTINRTMMYFS
jgi:phosphoglucomutase